MITFSVIMPSYLSMFASCAKDRENKFKRAVNSVLNQDYPFFELIIISDGCQKTIDILHEMNNNYELHSTRLVKVAKQKLWGGIRNFGIDRSQNDFIIYLDTDDLFTEKYLSEQNCRVLSTEPGK